MEKPSTFEEALKAHRSLEEQMHKELGCEEIFDPSHLSEEEKNHLEKIIYNLLKNKTNFILSQLHKEDPKLIFLSFYKLLRYLELDFRK